MGRKFTLTEANYHSRAARRRWLSSSDVKAAKRCESAWLADYCGKIKHEEFLSTLSLRRATLMVVLLCHHICRNP